MQNAGFEVSGEREGGGNEGGSGIAEMGMCQWDKERPLGERRGMVKRDRERGTN